MGNKKNSRKFKPKTQHRKLLLEKWPRPILVKISEQIVRDKVWFAKTKLKGSVTLSEFLTRPRHLAFMAATERYGVKSCWTRDGYIHIDTPDGERHRICTMSELNMSTDSR